MDDLSLEIKLDHPEVTRLLFHPRRQEKGQAPAGCCDLDIPVADGITVGARFYLAGKEAPNILFFHGNGEIVEDYDEIGAAFAARNMSFLAVDYRGYGWSGGEPSASRMMGDCHMVFGFVRNWLAHEERKGSFLVMGRSLGSACAIELAVTEREAVAGLIIDSGFASTLPLLRCLGLDVDRFGLREEECFNNLKKISRYSRPLLVLHAQLDEIIPIGEAAELQSCCVSRLSEFQIVPGADHNTIFAVTGSLYFEVVGRFVNKIGMPVRRRHTGRLGRRD
ncbi:MAG: alpha/beta hydrolase [Thermodesulfobacteriota bacterium]